jgi:hypothetical protein
MAKEISSSNQSTIQDEWVRLDKIKFTLVEDDNQTLNDDDQA